MFLYFSSSVLQNSVSSVHRLLVCPSICIGDIPTWRLQYRMFWIINILSGITICVFHSCMLSFPSLHWFIWSVPNGWKIRWQRSPAFQMPTYFLFHLVVFSLYFLYLNDPLTESTKVEHWSANSSQNQLHLKKQNCTDCGEMKKCSRFSW